MRRDLPRSVGVWAAAAIMVGVTVGSGIFKTPTDIARAAGSPTVILCLWVAGGLLSLCGAITYAELATMYPRSGGVFVFLYEGFGPMTAFVFGWTYMLITKPAAAAAIAVVFAEHLHPLVRATWDPAITTCVTLFVLTYINARGTRIGSGVAVVFTAAKVAALAAIVVLGLVLARDAGANWQALPAPLPLASSIVIVMASVLWTYDGWSDLGSIAGEVRDPQRMLPRIYLLGTLAIMALYLAVNAVYHAVVPIEEMRAAGQIAPLVMERLVGPQSGTTITLLIIISTVGATHAAIITGARVTFAQANEGLLFRVLGAVHPTHATPHVSLWTQFLLSCLAVLSLGTFAKLAGAFVFTMWIFYGLAAAAVIVLRIRRPHVPRPYRCWGYPWVPLVFIASAATMTVLAIIDSPSQTLPWVGLLLIGAPTYYLWRRFVPPEHPAVNPVQPGPGASV
jgi:APA family basic amino acid/polyamine antiporter